MILVYFMVVILGLCVGSFLNVIIYRLPKEISLIKGRSFCPRCKRKISWFDNIPLLSFLHLKGRCRYCKKPIPWRYPLVELLTGILFVLGTKLVLKEGEGLGGLGGLGMLEVLRVWLVISALVAVFFIDWDWQIIPDEVVFPVILVNFFYSLITNYQLLITNLLPTAAISSLFFLILHLLTKGKGMGLGDVKFTFLIGLVLGTPKAVVCFYLAFLTGAIIGLILILIRKTKFGKSIAFGPFLSLAFIVTLFAGEKILWLVKQIFF